LLNSGNMNVPKKCVNFLLLALILLLSVAVPAQTKEITTRSNSIPGVNIPDDVMKIEPQKDMVELIGLEAKARGGEPIARLEALDELLKPLLAEAAGYDIDIPDFALFANDLRNKLDAVGNASSVDESLAMLQAYMDAAYTMRDETSLALAKKPGRNCRRKPGRKRKRQRVRYLTVSSRRLKPK